uniref:Uncharacterized protein n=1 Tax=Daucus carota subsp. sativus TaxID=79200 RepID=A0A162AJH6_DAUCS
MKNCNPLKVRKGAWGSDEDALLRKCIHKFGEGKWHLVPQRAGLNRCRKSCRLRWLNYLRPTIKRGEFGEDEVDLMMRLHKLLGNRQALSLLLWSLIAGRLPGRTANDVKNFWNTNVQKKLATAHFGGHKEVVKGKELIKTKQNSSATTCTATTHTVVKPLPRTLSQGTSVLYYSLNPRKHMYSPPGKILKNRLSSNETRALEIPVSDLDGNEWWRNLFVEIGIDDEGSFEGLLKTSSSNLENLGDQRCPILKTNESFAPVTEATGLQEEDCRSWSDIWNLLNLDYI